MLKPKNKVFKHVRTLYNRIQIFAILKPFERREVYMAKKKKAKKKK